MQTTTADLAAVATPPVARDHWIDDWRPEDPVFWAVTGGLYGAVLGLQEQYEARPAGVRRG